MNGLDSFYMPTRIVFGKGSLGCAGKEAGRLGKKALIVTDQGIINTGLLDRVINSLDNEGIEHYTFSRVVPNPRDHDCSTGAAYALEKGVDHLVAIGGGSVLDTAKTIGCLVTHGGVPRDWAGVPLKKEILPLVCIPTTAGTGSEVTYSAVITDTERKTKITVSHPLLAPRTALADPSITLSMPRGLTASTGMDALTHAIEAYTCKQAQPMTDILALESIRLICRSIRKAVDRGSDLEARSDMMFGSMIAGIAFKNSDVAGVHCLAEALGGMYDTPHGVANSIFLPYLFEYNYSANIARHAEVAAAMGLPVAGLSPEEAAQAAVSGLKKMSRDVGIPRFSDLPEINPQDFPFIADNSARNGSSPSNAREITARDYLAILMKAYRERQQ